MQDYLDKTLQPDECIEGAYNIPYILTLESKTTALTYVGVEHTNSLEDPQILLIQKLFREFTQKHPRFSVGIEGVVPDRLLDIESAVKTNGERGLLTYLAHEEGMDIFPIVAYPQTIVAHIVASKKFSPMDIALWVFLNWLVFVSVKKETYEPSEILKHINAEITTVTHDELLARIKTLVGETVLPNDLATLNQEHIRTLKNLQSPYHTGSVLHDIAKELNYQMDRAMAMCVGDMVKSGKSAFAVVGHNHVVTQEPALRFLFNTL